MMKTTDTANEHGLDRPTLRCTTPHTAILPAMLVLMILLGACAGPVSGDHAPVPDSNASVRRTTPETGRAASVPVTYSSANATTTLPYPPIKLIPIASQYQQPILATHAGDGTGRLFVVEKVGTIRIVQQGQMLAQPFLDIRDRVGSQGNEQGLLGLAFAPNFAQTGHFFVNYTDKDGDTHVARFSVNAGTPNTADPSSEFMVLTIVQPARNHNAGMLAFGPDGYLYIGAGDGGGSYDTYKTGQDPATLLGKMVRIDVTSDPSVPYLVPPDNPWVGANLNGADVLDEIWAFGLRNPWRYSFDRATGDLWIADVGQNEYEEVNRTPAGSPGGLNYGWSIQEGSHCIQSGCDSAGLVQPVLEYGHVDGHCSITGGYVYRGSRFPQLDGLYFYGDYCSGAIWAAAPAGGGEWRSVLLLHSGVRISSFGEDESGELYVTDISGGVVYRLVQDFQTLLPMVRA